MTDKTIRPGWVFNCYQFMSHSTMPGCWRCSAHLDKPGSRVKPGAVQFTKELAISSCVRVCEAWEQRWDRVGHNWRKGLR